MKLSIIIPVYRTEHTLARCVESVLTQDFSDWEMWLVDDGSDDDAPTLCDELAQREERIHVIHQANAGLGPARNVALEKAQGEYVLFIDSDDYIEAHTLRPLVEIMNHAAPEVAFVEFPVYQWYGNAQKQKKLLVGNHRYEGQWDWWFNAQGYAHCYAWNKLFRRTAIAQTRFRNKKFEDAFFLSDLFKKPLVSLSTDQGLYYYCYNPQGITERARRSLSDLLEAHAQVLEALHWKCPEGIATKLFNNYCAQVLNVQIDVFRFCQGKVLLRRLPAHHTPKLMAQRLLGISLFCRIFNLFRRLCKFSLS